MVRYKKIITRLILLMSIGILFNGCFIFKKKCGDCPTFSQKKNHSHVVVAVQGAVNENQ